MPNKVLHLDVNIRPWGATSGDVFNAVSTIVFEANAPTPFETEPNAVDLKNIEKQIIEACDTATARRRKGMMISSRFSVSRLLQCVIVHHIRNEKEPRRFLTIVKK